jgi:hypothetical protein
VHRALTTAVALALAAAAGAAPLTAAPEAVVSALSADGSTALLMAAYEGDAARVAQLLKAGADARQGNRYGATPLSEASRRGDVDVMRLLLRAGADANEANAEGQTALMAVARTGNLTAATLLLQHGAKVDTREHWGGQTALIWAAAQNQPAMIKLLASKGADVNARATVRDWQRHTTQFTPGKNFAATGALGPWMVTRDELPDPSKLEVSLRLNGDEMQRSTTDLLIFDVPALLEYISSFTELVPGDVIATGTPGGVGWKRDPPVFMRHGDVVEVEVRGVGVLRNRVVDEPSDEV